MPLKRLNDGDLRQESKRLRTLHFPTTFSHIPAELRQQIFQRAIEDRNPRDTFETIKSLKLTDRRTNFETQQIVDHKRDHAGFSNFLMQETARLKKLPVIHHGNYRSSLDDQKRNTLTAESLFLPLEKAEERSRIVREVLARKDERFAPKAVARVIANLEHTTPAERARIVDHVSNHWTTSSDSVLADSLVEKVEHLKPSDRSRVADWSMFDRNPRILAQWAKKASLVPERQEDLIKAASGPERANAHALGAFAGEAGQLSTDNRKLLVKKILELPNDNEGKWFAVSELTRNLKTFDEHTRHAIIEHVTDNSKPLDNMHLQQPNGREFFQKPDFAQTEAFYHLSRSELVQNALQKQVVKNYIGHQLSNDDNLTAKAQLIDHMDENQRNAFMTKADYAGRNETEQILNGLAVRASVLTDVEKNYYVSAEFTSRDEPHFHTIERNLEHFNKEDRSALIQAGIEGARAELAPEAAKLASKMRNFAKYLDVGDVRAVNDLTQELYAQAEEEDMDQEELESLVGDSAKNLADWAADDLSRTASIHTTIKSSEPQRRYDSRSREASVSRD